MGDMAHLIDLLELVTMEWAVTSDSKRPTIKTTPENDRQYKRDRGMAINLGTLINRMRKAMEGKDG